MLCIFLHHFVQLKEDLLMRETQKTRGKLYSKTMCRRNNDDSEKKKFKKKLDETGECDEGGKGKRR